jgi:DNA-binding IclR family transcriptional regulator
MKLRRSSPDRYYVEAVGRALDILETFGKDEGLTLKAISDQVGLGRSRAFRLLHTLAERGYVERTSDGRGYSLGRKLFERAAFVRRTIRQTALPLMHKLHERFNETVNLGILDNHEIVYIEMLESTHPFRMVAAIGTRSPVHACALGKAMAAFLPEPEATALLANANLTKLTERTNTDAAKLGRELGRVRKYGYALDIEETESGVACVGGPILDRGGWPAAGISVSGPANRILGWQREIADAVVSASIDISRGLGYPGVPCRESAEGKGLQKS